MKTNGKKSLIWILILTVTLISLIFAAEKSVIRTGENDRFEIQNQSNVGKIDRKTVISQTFEAQEPFQGISCLIGTFGEKQYGWIRVKIKEQESGKTVFDRPYNTAAFDDNKYFYFASGKKIEVSTPTTFELTIEGKAAQPGLGVTIWCSTDNLYEEGILCINGAEQTGDLCFGLVQNYEESMGWGIFAKRCMIILLVSAFLSLHCFLDIRKMYQFIFEKRVWIAALLVVFCVINKFNGSSINQFDDYIQPGEGSEYVTPVFGTSRSIRSDEWLVSVPRSISAEYTGYGKMNDIVRATETTNLSASGLYLNYSALAKPADWGYYLFGSEYGLAFVWSFRMIFGFLFSFELCMILSKQNRLLSLMGGTMIWFSSFNMWWSTVTWLIAGQAAIVFSYYFIREKNRWKRALYGIGIALSASNFAVDLYPAWQVPAGYVFLALLIWIFVDNASYWKKYRLKDWLLAGGCIAFMLSVIGVYFYNYMDYMTAIMNTVYPGGRTYYGGFSINKLLGYLTAWTSSLIKYENPSEMGCFFGLFPLSVLIFIYVLYRKKGKSLLMWLLMVPAVLMSLYCVMPLPEIVAKLTLLTFSMPKRVVDVLGYLNVLMLIVALSELQGKKKLSLPTGVLLAGISTATVLFYSILCCDRKMKIALVLLAAMITFVSEVCLISDVKIRKTNMVQICLTVMIMTAGLVVNPLMCGLDAINSKPVASEIRKLTADDPKAKWIAVDSIITPDYLIACGARTYNSTNYVPNMDFWKKLDPSGEKEEVYNRYAHICITLTEKDTDMELVDTDYIQLNLNYDDLEKMDVSYILSVEELKNADEKGLSKLYSEYGMYIYKVSENSY